jgi:hypothetical protein
MTSLEDALTAAISASIAGVHVALPCAVESYDPATGKATLRPLIRHAYTDEAGETQQEDLPLITGVPVVFPGAGAVRITFPIVRGTKVLAIFCHKNLDAWLHSGGVVDDAADRSHALSDALAIPGLYDFAHVPTTAPTDAMVMHGSSIKLGGTDATDPVVRRSDLAAVVTALNEHTHASIDGPAAPVATTPACSTTVRAK